MVLDLAEVIINAEISYDEIEENFFGPTLFWTTFFGGLKVLDAWKVEMGRQGGKLRWCHHQ